MICILLFIAPILFLKKWKDSSHKILENKFLNILHISDETEKRENA